MTTDPKTKKAEKGTKSMEVIYHFTCKECNKWWSIGDAPKTRKEWHCPWCGAKNCYDE